MVRFPAARNEELDGLAKGGCVAGTGHIAAWDDLYRRVLIDLIAEDST